MRLSTESRRSRSLSAALAERNIARPAATSVLQCRRLTISSDQQAITNPIEPSTLPKQRAAETRRVAMTAAYSRSFIRDSRIEIPASVDDPQSGDAGTG